METAQPLYLILLLVLAAGLLLLALAGGVIALIYFLRRRVSRRDPAQYERLQSLVSAPALSLHDKRLPQADLHAGDSVTMDASGDVEPMLILRRLHELEEELQELKSYYIKPPTTLRQKIHKGLDFFANNWAFLSFAGTIILLTYIQVRFGVDYFENYRDIRTSKELSDFYKVQGDTLLGMTEWEAAQEAYQRALEIDENNEEALYGLAKAQVFNPIEGRKYLIPEVAEIKINGLFSKFKDDYQLYFLKGWLYYIRQDLVNAIAWTEKAVEINREFVGGLVQLGFYHQRTDFKKASDYYQSALRIDPNNAFANNNMGYMFMLKGDFLNATDHLTKAFYTSPMLITALSLGDVYLYTGEFEKAKRFYSHALKMIEEPNEENARYIGGEWLYNAMPLQPGDEETVKYWASFYSLDQKRILIYYDLSFYYALAGETDQASEYFQRAFELDQSRDYDIYINYRIQSLQNFVSMSVITSHWFDNHRANLVTK